MTKAELLIRVCAATAAKLRYSPSPLLAFGEAMEIFDQHAKDAGIEPKSAMWGLGRDTIAQAAGIVWKKP